MRYLSKYEMQSPSDNEDEWDLMTDEEREEAEDKASSHADDQLDFLEDLW